MIFLSFYSIFDRTFYKQSVETDQTPRSAMSDLCLYCLPISHKKDFRLIWVNTNRNYLTDPMESDLGCTSRVYFDNVMLTSQKPC